MNLRTQTTTINQILGGGSPARCCLRSPWKKN